MSRKFGSLVLTAVVLAVGMLAGGGPLLGRADAQLVITVMDGFQAYDAKVRGGVWSMFGLAAFPPLLDFPCCIFVIDQVMARVLRSDGTWPTRTFGDKLSTPVDLRPAPGGGSGPFGNFLYVSEAGANRIRRIDKAGTVTAFATVPAPPRRLAFSPTPGAFGTFLFVTLADGQLVKIDPTGTVSPCASGLSGPEGLVFGPGGTAYKNILFVAESTGNRISKVSPTCTVTPFATGLSAPVGLTISPGGGWGPVDTLYVANGTTRVDRVDKDGRVTPFASGWMQVDTVRFRIRGPKLASRLGENAVLHVSDARFTALWGVELLTPSISPELTGCNPCRAGESFALNITVRNSSPLALPVEVKGGFRLPDGTPINFSPFGSKHFETVLPARMPTTTMPWLSFPMPAVPPGRYCYVVGLADPELFDMSVRHNRTCFGVLP